MTYQPDCTLPTELLEQIAEQGLAVLPELSGTVINIAMQLEWQRYLGVAPYERSEGRRCQANGYKAKTVATRAGEITFFGGLPSRPLSQPAAPLTATSSVSARQR